MAEETTYEGWSNRETWCTNLWLANDQGLYEDVRDYARDALADVEDDDSTRDFTYTASVKDEATHALSVTLRDMFEGFEHGDGEDDYVPAPGIYKVLRDIGSLYRVDWYEIAKSWVEEAIEEAREQG